MLGPDDGPTPIRLPHPDLKGRNEKVLLVPHALAGGAIANDPPDAPVSQQTSLARDHDIRDRNCKVLGQFLADRRHGKAVKGGRGRLGRRKTLQGLALGEGDRRAAECPFYLAEAIEIRRRRRQHEEQQRAHPPGQQQGKARQSEQLDEQGAGGPSLRPVHPHASFPARTRTSHPAWRCRSRIVRPKPWPPTITSVSPWL